LRPLRNVYSKGRGEVSLLRCRFEDADTTLPFGIPSLFTSVYTDNGGSLEQDEEKDTPKHFPLKSLHSYEFSRLKNPGNLGHGNLFSKTKAMEKTNMSGAAKADGGPMSVAIRP